MKTTVRLFLLVVAGAAILGGCGGAKMPLQDDAEKLSARSKPVLLLSVTLRNAYKPATQPVLLNVQVSRGSDPNSKELMAFPMDDKGVIKPESEGQPVKYLVRLELEPGSYTMRTLHSGTATGNIKGNFVTPLLSPFTVSSGGVYYLGSIEGTVRERQGNEFRAGPVTMPYVTTLITQRLSGAYDGTWDVAVSDRLAEDLALFRMRFPALRDIPVSRMVLPPFDRSRAQAWWEEN